jgi:hypothetical protein
MNDRQQDCDRSQNYLATMTPILRHDLCPLLRLMLAPLRVVE